MRILLVSLAVLAARVAAPQDPKTLHAQAQDLLFDDYSDMELLCSDVYITHS